MTSQSFFPTFGPSAPPLLLLLVPGVALMGMLLLASFPYTANELAPTAVEGLPLPLVTAAGVVVLTPLLGLKLQLPARIIAPFGDEG